MLPSGELTATSRCARKSSAGYDLTRLSVGAEGTLGVIAIDLNSPVGMLLGQTRIRQKSSEAATSFRQARLEQCIKEVIIFLRIPVFHSAVPVCHPVLEIRLWIR